MSKIRVNWFSFITDLVIDVIGLLTKHSSNIPDSDAKH